MKRHRAETLRRLSNNTMAKKKTSAKEQVALINSSAERLSEVRKLINTREERFKEETDALYAEEKQLKADVLLGLKDIGLVSVRTEGGDSYYISKTQDFIPKNPLAYEKWAKESGLVRIDSSMAKTKLRELLKKDQVPDFIEVRPRETISVKTAKKETE